MTESQTDFDWAQVDTATPCPDPTEAARHLAADALGDMLAWILAPVDRIRRTTAETVRLRLAVLTWMVRPGLLPRTPRTLDELAARFNVSVWVIDSLVADAKTKLGLRCNPPNAEPQHRAGQAGDRPGV